MSSLPVLVVEDDAPLREALCDTLQLAGYSVIAAADGGEALGLLQQQSVGIIVSDVQMQPMDGLTLLHRVRELTPHIPVLMMTAFGDIDHAVKAMQAGACHYLAKPFEPQRLLSEVARFMLTAGNDVAGEALTEDARMAEVLGLAKRVALSDATVLITGESGTGKEVLARYIHRHSTRADKPFVAINCAAIPEALLEATLFGHEKGAFTGAAQAQAGKFEQAQHGTLLLDEISEMPLLLQTKLLRVLQEREVERVGGRATITLDIRVVATSNRNMADEVAAGRFREDLYYRLNVFPLELPPLRLRRADILPLAVQFLRRYAQKMQRGTMELAATAEQALLQHSWPGNVRELENVIQRAVILAPANTIEVAHLFLPSSGQVEAPKVAALAPEPATDMKSLERQHILDALKAANGVRKVAAERLGMSERTLRHKLQQYKSEGWLQEEGN